MRESLARDSKLIGFASEIKQGFNFFIFERERERENLRDGVKEVLRLVVRCNCIKLLAYNLSRGRLTSVETLEG